MLPPVEEKPQSPRNLSLNLNLQNTTQSPISSEIDPHEHEDVIDENTKLLTIERQEYEPGKFTSNGNLRQSGGNKTNYNMNITNNNLCSNNLINTNHNNNSIIKSGDAESRDEFEAANENSVNNNDETNSTVDKKIIKMTKLGTKNVTLKR